MQNQLSNDELIDLRWIESIEGEGGTIRDHDIYPMLRDWAHSSNSILDLGCGQGICSENIGLTDKTYIGVDLSPRLIARAQEKYTAPNRKFVVGSAYEIPSPDLAFDGVFSVNLFHLLEDLSRVIEEIRRVLRPGGKFLIITANPDAYDLWINYYSESILDGKRLEGTSRYKDKTSTKEILFLHSLNDINTGFEATGLIINSTLTFRKSPKENQKDYYLAIYGQK